MKGIVIVVAKWPEALKFDNLEGAARQMEVMMDAIKGIRNMRAEMNVPLGKKSRGYRGAYRCSISSNCSRPQRLLRNISMG